MSSSVPPPTGRRRSSTRKGDERELAILDTAERLMAEVGFEAMTVESVAHGAGISRGSLYFYFGSKQDILAALVARTLTEITSAPSHSPDNPDPSMSAIIRAALLDTETAWREHGRIMQAAVEFCPAIPDVHRLWRETLESVALAFGQILVRGGVPDDPGPTGAVALARSLAFMTERSYYWSYAESGTDRLHEVTDTLVHIWTGPLLEGSPSA